MPQLSLRFYRRGFWLLSLILAAQLCFAVALFVFPGGRSAAVENEPGSEPSGVRARAETSIAADETAALRDSLARLMDSIAAALGGSDGAGYRLVSELRRAPGVTIKIPVLDGARVVREPRLNPAIATLFELSPQAVAALDSRIAATRRELLELRRQNSTVAQAEDGSIELRSASFAEEGGAAHDALMRAFENALGEEAFRHFLAVADQSLDHDFGYYGAQETTITLGKSLDAEGRAVYPVTRAVARETGSSETTGVFVSPADIWSFDGDALQLIPQAYIEALLAAEPTAPDAPRASR